jgi:hypothetical protein
MTDEAWNALSAEQKREHIKKESDHVLWLLDMITAGLAVRRAGLIWMLPLCHDSYGENV